MPWPLTGVIACAASPASSTRPERNPWATRWWTSKQARLSASTMRARPGTVTVDHALSIRRVRGGGGVVAEEQAQRAVRQRHRPELLVS
jgi:hypothetical protein